MVRSFAITLGVFCFYIGICVGAEDRPIRLRNEHIRPSAETSLDKRPPGAAKKLDSGLHLIQFTEHFQPNWREQLKAHGIVLLQYVPDDAFIARFENVDAQEVKKLPFVNWLGKYRPDHKVHQSIARRMAQKKAGELANISVLISPAATQAEVAEVKQLLQTVRQQSKLRLGSVLRGAIPSAQLEALANSEVVLWIEPEFHPKLVDEIASKIVAGDDSPHVTAMEALGYDGTGVRVAVADSGLHTGLAATMHPDLAGRANTFFYYGALTDASDEHGHGTHCAGIIAGNGATGETDETDALYGLGVAPNANIIAQRIFDADGNFNAPDSFEILTHDAVRAGADVGSNSWGDDTQGRYDISAAEYDELVRDADAETFGDQPYILEFSAGNAGPGSQTVGSPAVAKNVIATGASENDRLDFFLYADGIDAMADFSSRGPCEDGRIKPDVTAPGTWISSLRSVLGNDDFAWAVISDNYIYEGGTSQAGPHVSGAAAVFVQYYRSLYGGTPSPALVKAALINSAADMDNTIETGPVPNMDEGWGRVDLTRLIGSTRSFNFVDQTATLSTGQTYEQHVLVSSSDEPLRITLAYTDVPGFPGALPALVNDLDLQVMAPDGQIFFGNQFDEGESTSSSSAADPINNVEAVYLSTPDPGEYVVRVYARNVVDDARHDTPQVDQDFALVMSGHFPAPNSATVILDRSAYRAPGDIRIRLFDTALAGQASATVTASSTTEPNGESILLHASTSGILTGHVATVTGAASADGRLQIANGDQIHVTFLDPISHQPITASAVADFVPPIISGVSATNQFGREVISWQTDERSSSIVRFGTNSTLNFGQTNLFLSQNHEIKLSDLRPGVLYYFLVSSTDAAGNSATDNNSGQLYTFTMPLPATVLLVNAYEPDEFTPEIPLSTYTDPLNAIGASYDLWDIEAGAPSPGTNDLHPYRVVIWRVSDSIGTSSTLSPDEQNAVRNYLGAGGAFLFTSMEHLSRLPAAFSAEVLHVTAFNEDVGVPEILGVASNPVGAGTDMTLDYSAYDTDIIEEFGLSPDLSDTITVAPDAASLFVAADSQEIAGMTYPRIGQSSTGRVVFLSFPLDVVPASGAVTNNRAALLKSVLDFLAPGQNGIGEIHLDRPRYTLPSQVSLEVADSDLAGAGRLVVQLYSDSITNRVNLVLNETLPPGLFRGSISLGAITNSPAPDLLRAKSGDTIYAEYFDASSAVTVRAVAVIDTTAPAISGIITVEPEFVDAIVSWETSEASDSLVQFGESILLGRTGYDPGFETSHEVVLTGLLPDHLYYYEVISRDVAGNPVIDDNHGQLYTFRTLVPLVPPFLSTFDSGEESWQVSSSDTSEAAWTLGTPNNGLDTQGYTPPNAWGSSLNGGSFDEIDTFLISPPIDLTGGNSAKLNFWTSYDFSSQSEFDIYEAGILLIITNNASDPVQITDYGDSSGGAYDEEIDLTPYVGNVVSLVWYHTLLSLDSAPRAGWLVDNVSVSITNIPSGTLVVSNNLAQANFLISGPTSRSGRGYLVVTNLLPGQYSVNFSAVPYYQTPPAKTVVLDASARLLVQGNYTFADANSNGISDAWEQQWFGNISPSRTRFTDSDGDGMTDYAEFIAGTNPNSTNSSLKVISPVLLNDRSIRLEWVSVPSRNYRVWGSSNAVDWLPLSDWIQATASPTIFSRPPFSLGATYLFRIEVHQ